MDLENFECWRTSVTIATHCVVMGGSIGRILLLSPHIGVTEFDTTGYQVRRRRSGLSTIDSHTLFKNRPGEKRCYAFPEGKSHRIMPGESFRYAPEMVSPVETHRPHAFLPSGFSRKTCPCDEVGQHCERGPPSCCKYAFSPRVRSNSSVRSGAGLDLNPSLWQMALVHLP